MYGTQAINWITSSLRKFENDVKMYGTQADRHPISKETSLRMM